METQETLALTTAGAADTVTTVFWRGVIERADDVILRPKDPYTRELRAASPDPEAHFGPLTVKTAGGAL